jgi:hypothetical protein
LRLKKKVGVASLEMMIRVKRAWEIAFIWD